MAAVATMKGFEGYWGPPTATMDWCEGNYLVILGSFKICGCSCTLILMRALLSLSRLSL